MAKTDERGVWDQDPPESGRAGSTFVKRTSSSKEVVKTKVVRDDWDDDDDEEEEGEQVEGGEERDMNGDMKAMTKAMASGTVNDGTAPVPRLSGRRSKDAEERKGEEDSSKIWEEANKRAPMPELIVAPASTSQSAPPPPPAALQPTLRILKRPSPNASASNVGHVSSTSLSSSSPGPTSGSGSGSGSGGTSPAPRGTLAEREAQYQEARSRIFGGKEKPGSMSGNVSSGGVGVVVVRDPLGPASEPEVDPGMSGQDTVHDPGRPAKGFGERRRGKKYL